jgi:hypothetical protein
MPASLYRLAGKPHHSEVSTQLQQTVVTDVADAFLEQAQVVEPELAVEQKAIISAQVNDIDSNVSENVEENVVKTQLSWEPSWTKTQLFDVAVAAGLPVTATNTKSEIIALLNTNK